MSSSQCYICDEPTMLYCKDITALRSKYSDISVISILEELLEQSLALDSIDPNVETKIFCQDCLWKVDEYDKACCTIKQLKEEFRLLVTKDKFSMEIIEKLGSDLDDDADADADDDDNVGLTTEMEMMDNDEDGTIMTGEEIEQNNYINIKLEHVGDEEDETDDNVVVVPVKSYAPKECNQIFNDMKEIKTHKKNHKISKVEVKNEFITKKGSKKIVTPKKSSAVNSDLSCTECFEVFPTKLQLAHHKKIHDFRCPKCDGLYPDAESLRAHIVKHDFLDPLQCAECLKQFAKRNNLARHMPIHTDEKLYQCEICGKEYIHHSSFRMHKMAHSNIREKSCAICGLTFRSQSHLTRHSRIHTGAKPYECPVCNQKFAQRYNMSSHMKIHNNTGGGSSSIRKPHNCVICGGSYAKPLLLREHMKRAHTITSTVAESETATMIEIATTTTTTTSATSSVTELKILNDDDISEEMIVYDAFSGVKTEHDEMS